MNKKGFTLIELLVVTAILGILVLLATPKFFGYAERANTARMQTDIRLVENVVSYLLIKDPELTKDWEMLTQEDISELNDSKKLLTREGEIKGDLESGLYIPIDSIPELSQITSKGEFILEEDSVYLNQTSVSGKSSSFEKETEENVDNDEAAPKYPIIHKNGDIEEEDGTVLHINGDITQPDGTMIKLDGTTYYLNGDVKQPDGIINHKDGSYTRVDGIKVHPDESVTLKDGTFIPVATDADFVNRDGVVQYIGSKKELVIPSVIHQKPVTTYHRLFEKSSVTRVVSLNENVTSMTNMFANSTSNSLDLSVFDTSGVTDMFQMFYSSKVTSLDLSSFDTSNVVKMRQMFQNSLLTDLNVSSFDTSNATDMQAMFYGIKVSSLDLSNFNTSKVAVLDVMFYGLNLDVLDLSSFDTSNATSMRTMFSNSKIKKAYAKTYEDASRMNLGQGNPPLLIVEVKN